MTSDERDRRRDIKDAYRREHGGALSYLDRLLDDAARCARLRGSMASLGFAIATVAAVEACRLRDITPDVLLKPLATEGRVGPVLWHNVRQWPIAAAPAFPAPCAPPAMRLTGFDEAGLLVLERA